MIRRGSAAALHHRAPGTHPAESMIRRRTTSVAARVAPGRSGPSIWSTLSAAPACGLGSADRPWKCTPARVPRPARPIPTSHVAPDRPARGSPPRPVRRGTPSRARSETTIFPPGEAAHPSVVRRPLPRSSRPVSVPQGWRALPERPCTGPSPRPPVAVLDGRRTTRPSPRPRLHDERSVSLPGTSDDRPPRPRPRSDRPCAQLSLRPRAPAENRRSAGSIAARRGWRAGDDCPTVASFHSLHRAHRPCSAACLAGVYRREVKAGLTKIESRTDRHARSTRSPGREAVGIRDRGRRDRRRDHRRPDVSDPSAGAIVPDLPDRRRPVRPPPVGYPRARSARQPAPADSRRAVGAGLRCRRGSRLGSDPTRRSKRESCPAGAARSDGPATPRPAGLSVGGRGPRSGAPAPDPEVRFGAGAGCVSPGAPGADASRSGRSARRSPARAGRFFRPAGSGCGPRPEGSGDPTRRTPPAPTSPADTRTDRRATARLRTRE